MCIFLTRVVMCCLVLWAHEARAQTQTETPPPAVSTPPTQMVLPESPSARLVVWNRTLAVLRATLGNATPALRAEAASARIETALDRLDPAGISYSVAQLGSERGVVIFGGGALFAILEGDLPQDGADSLEAAGAQAVSRLQLLLREHAEQTQWRLILRNIVQALLATIAFVAIWLAGRRAYLWLLTRLTRQAATWMKQPDIAGIDPRPFVVSALEWLLWVAELAVRITAAYLWLTFVLSRFAYSRPWGRTLGEFLIDTLTRMAAAVVDEIPNLVTLGIILFVTRGVAAAAGGWFRAVERGDLHVSWLDPVAAIAARRLMVLAIWLFAITVAYPYIPGASTDAFKGVSVFVGLVVSLGSAGVVGQMMGGLFVTFNRALRPGDVVRVGNVTGIVKELGIVSVTVVTRAHEEVTIPNAVVVADAITNFSRLSAGSIAVSTSVTIGYGTPWRQVRAMLLVAAARTDGILREPAPAVFETELSDFSVTYHLVAQGTTAVIRPVLLSRLHEQILDVFNEHGVQIMAPHFEAQPEKLAIVERSQWFANPATPGFKDNDR